MAKQLFTVESIKNMSLSQIENLSIEDLRKATNILISASKKRAERLKNKNYESSALQEWESSGRTKTYTQREIKSMGKPKDILFAQLQHTMSFILDPTSTIRGAEAEIRGTLKSIAFETTDNIGELFDRFNKTYGAYSTSIVASAIRMFKEIHASIYLAGNKSIVENVMREYSKDRTLTANELFQKIEYFTGVKSYDVPGYGDNYTYNESRNENLDLW